MDILKGTYLEKKEDRIRLKKQKHPYYTLLSPDCHLGYYKGSKRGSWVVRWLSKENDQYKQETLGRADDLCVANGRNILSYTQARFKAEQFMLKQQTFEDAMATPLDKKTMKFLNFIFDYIKQVKSGISEPLKGFSNDISMLQKDNRFSWMNLKDESTNHGRARKYLKMLREKEAENKDY